MWVLLTEVTTKIIRQLLNIFIKKTFCTGIFYGFYLYFSQYLQYLILYEWVRRRDYREICSRIYCLEGYSITLQP